MVLGRLSSAALLLSGGAALVAPERVAAALEGAGLVDLVIHKEWGIFSQYTARKPA